jgi:hypothetical protein
MEALVLRANITCCFPMVRWTWGEVWDIDTLVAKVWGDEEVQHKLAEMWQNREREIQAQGKVTEFLAKSDHRRLAQRRTR